MNKTTNKQENVSKCENICVICHDIGGWCMFAYFLIATSIIFLNFAEGCGVHMPQLLLQYTAFWSYIPRMLLAGTMIGCYGVQVSVQQKMDGVHPRSMQMLLISILVAVCIFVELLW